MKSRLLINPLFDNNGERIGSCVEWYDVTQEYKQKLIDEDNDRFRNEQTKVIEALANNDLTKRMPSDFTQSENLSIANKFNESISKLNALLANTLKTLNAVTSSVGKVSKTSDILSSSSTEQASAIEEISSNIEQSSSQIQSNSENAGNANSCVTEATQFAEDGKEKVLEMIKSINNIAKSSEEISKIIKVIDDIAFQTNLLALNAAVEAARAGQHGKGFAVVAQEVRNLAGRSAEAAKETAELIDMSVKSVKQGVSMAQDSEQSLIDIVSQIEKVKDLVSDISIASKEQAIGMSQVNTAISEVNVGVQEVSDNGVSLSGYSKELADFVGKLNTELTQFTINQQETGASSSTETLSNLTPEMMAQLMAQMQAGQSNGGHQPSLNQGCINQDNRDFGDF